MAGLARYFRLSTVASFVLAAMFFCSTPCRNTIGNGQTALLCFVAVLGVWLYQARRETASGLGLSVLLVKYSFAPPVLFWFLINHRVRLLVLSLAPLILGWLWFSWLCHESPLTTLTQPLKVANLYSESAGGGDVMTLVASFGWDRPALGDLRLSSFAGLAASCLGVIALRVRAAKLTEQELFAALCVIAMISLRHLPYDYVFLAPAAALAFSRSRARMVLSLCLISYFWFTLKILDNLNVHGRGVELLGFVALLALLFDIFRGSAQARPDRVRAP